MIDFLLNTPNSSSKVNKLSFGQEESFFVFVFTDLENSKRLRDNSRLVTRTVHSGA